MDQQWHGGEGPGAGAPPPPQQWAPPPPPPLPAPLPPAAPPPPGGGFPPPPPGHGFPPPPPPPGHGFTPPPPPPGGGFAPPTPEGGFGPPPTEPPTFDPDALFRPPPVNRPYVEPNKDKVHFTPGLIVAVVVAIAMLAGAAVWAFGQSTSKPTALAPLQGTLPTIPMEDPTTTVPAGGYPAAPPQLPAAAPGGFVNEPIAGMTFDLPTDCRSMSATGMSLGSGGKVRYACSTPEPRRIVLIATLDLPAAQFDGSDRQREEVARGVADELDGLDVQVTSEAHQVFGRPGVLLNIKMNQDGVDVYETAAVGNGPSGLVLIIVGQANSPWTDGMRVIDSAR